MSKGSLEQNFLKKLYFIFGNRFFRGFGMFSGEMAVCDYYVVAGRSKRFSNVVLCDRVPSFYIFCRLICVLCAFKLFLDVFCGYNTPYLSAFRPIMCLYWLHWTFIGLLMCYNYLSYHYFGQ